MSNRNRRASSRVVQMFPGWIDVLCVGCSVGKGPWQHDCEHIVALLRVLITGSFKGIGYQQVKHFRVSPRTFMFKGSTVHYYRHMLDREYVDGGEVNEQSNRILRSPLRDSLQSLAESCLNGVNGWSRIR